MVCPKAQTLSHRQRYLRTVVSERVIWHLGYTKDASAAALTESYGTFQRAASQQEPSYRVRGILSDGFDSPLKSIRPFSRDWHTYTTWGPISVVPKSGHRRFVHWTIRGMALPLAYASCHCAHVGWPDLACRKCGVEVEGRRLPTRDWLLNLQILTSGGFQ